MPTVAKSAFRSFRDFAKGYSPMKIKVIRATNTDPYGPTMAQLDLIARASHNPRHFIDIQHVLDRRMGDHGKFWRHIFKSLVVLQYCLVFGNDRVISYGKHNLPMIRMLREFRHIDKRGIEQGSSVRQKASEIVQLLSDDAALALARRTKTLPNQSRSLNIEPIALQDRNPSPPPPTRTITRSSSYMEGYDEDSALAIALAQSKEEYDQRMTTTTTSYYPQHQQQQPDLLLLDLNAPEPPPQDSVMDDLASLMQPIYVTMPSSHGSRSRSASRRQGRRSPSPIQEIKNPFDVEEYNNPFGDDEIELSSDDEEYLKGWGEEDDIDEVYIPRPDEDDLYGRRAKLSSMQFGAQPVMPPKNMYTNRKNRPEGQ